MDLRQTLRRGVAPLAFLGALVLLATRTCGSEAAVVELRFDFGSAAANVRALQVDVYQPDEDAPVAYHRADFGAGGAPESPQSWKLRVAAGTYVLKLRVSTGSGVRYVTRRVEISDRAVVTISLEAELGAP